MARRLPASCPFSGHLAYFYVCGRKTAVPGAENYAASHASTMKTTGHKRDRALWTLQSAGIQRWSAVAMALMFLASSCISPPEYPPEPFLEFASITRTDFSESLNEPIVLRVSFTDGDGDIGHGTPSAGDTTRNVFLEDSRVPGFPINYHIDAVEGVGNVSAISGFIDLRFNPGFFACLGSEPSDTLSLSLYLIDRAGNRSNTIRTPVLTLRCQ
jgi:hypothetical protein